MSEIDKLRSFIDSFRYHERFNPSAGSPNGCFPFVTISRLTGAGGHALAAELLTQIEEHSGDALFSGWQLCDQELFHALAQDPHLKPSVESLTRLEYHSHTEDILEQLICGSQSQDVVIKKMLSLIRTLALHGKVIVVGRGGAFVTRDLSYGLHVRLVASLESRVRRVMNCMNVSEKVARDTIAEKEQAKAELVKTFFSKDIRDPLLYDAVWNTDRIPLRAIARILLDMIRSKEVETQAEAVPSVKFPEGSGRGKKI
ncbi:MAG: cytidylate kinase-like family protein [Candidatus Omnitrophica bacterium]|nr:cytidylate kinase-like family protein [Candidatus Omnitrophota bacterium]